MFAAEQDHLPWQELICQTLSHHVFSTTCVSARDKVCVSWLEPELPSLLVRTGHPSLPCGGASELMVVSGSGTKRKWFFIAPNRMWACKLLTRDAQRAGGLGKIPEGGGGSGGGAAVVEG